MTQWEPSDRIDRSPTYVSSALALAAGVLTVTVTADLATGLVTCVAGVVVLAVGLTVGRQWVVTAASALLVVGVLLAAAEGAAVVAALIGIMSALLAFDLASTAVDLGEQLGRETATARVELLHAGASTLVGLVTVVVAFAVNQSVTGDQPVSAVLGLVIAVLLLVAALRRADPVA